MAQQVLTIGESGLNALNAINSNFTELYGVIILPIKLPGVAANTTQDIPANSFINDVFLFPASGTPTVRIGTAPNGTDLMPDTVINSFSQATIQQYFANDTTIYITITGGGSVNIRINIIYNFY